MLPSIVALTFVAPLLADDSTPLSAGAQNTIFTLLGVTVAILGIIAFFKRKPSLDEELVKFQLSIESLQGTVTELTTAVGKHSGHDTEISNLREKVKRLKEQRETDAKTQRSYIGHISKEISEGMDKIRDSMATNLQSVERAMGRVEGEVSGLSTRVGRIENKI